MHTLETLQSICDELGYLWQTKWRVNGCAVVGVDVADVGARLEELIDHFAVAALASKVEGSVLTDVDVVR